MIAPNVHDILKKHQSQGDSCAIITATNDFITQPIADFFQTPLIATRAEKIKDTYTGRFKGHPCFSHFKVDRLKEWLTAGEQDYASSVFYSDSINDLPLLEHVDKAVAVNPDNRLLDIAKARNWQCIFHP